MSEQDREFWLMVRRALLMICKAIEKRYIDEQAITAPCVTHLEKFTERWDG